MMKIRKVITGVFIVLVTSSAYLYLSEEETAEEDYGTIELVEDGELNDENLEEHRKEAKTSENISCSSEEADSQTEVFDIYGQIRRIEEDSTFNLVTMDDVEYTVNPKDALVMDLVSGEFLENPVFETGKDIIVSTSENFSKDKSEVLPEFIGLNADETNRHMVYSGKFDEEGISSDRYFQIALEDDVEIFDKNLNPLEEDSLIGRKLLLIYTGTS